MEKIISFIIPSYNVENCLPVCLDSFLIQESEGFSQLEVIVVDDGSRDRTAEIAGSYVKRFPSVYRLIQKENGGHGSAINAGSQAASGKYMKVVDADDWVVTENLGELVKRFSSCEADVVLTPFHMVDAKTNQREKRLVYLDDFSRILALDEIMSDWKSFDRCLTFHGISYKRSFYESYRHKLPEKIFYEDQEYAAVPCCHAKTIQAFNLYFYQYLIGTDSQSVAAHNQLKRLSHIEIVATRIAEYHQLHPELSFAGKSYLLQKLQAVLLSYYTTACIVNPNKADGRKKCRQLNEVIKGYCPQSYAAIMWKYRIFDLFSRLHLTSAGYEKLLCSSLYNTIRHNHPREHE